MKELKFIGICELNRKYVEKQLKKIREAYVNGRGNQVNQKKGAYREKGGGEDRSCYFYKCSPLLERKTLM